MRVEANRHSHRYGSRKLQKFMPGISVSGGDGRKEVDGPFEKEEWGQMDVRYEERGHAWGHYPAG